MTYLLLTLSIFLVAYLVVLPISKNRPILIPLFKTWIIYGVSKEQINNALERAMLATRSKYRKLDNYYEIDNSLGIRIRHLTRKIHLVSFRTIVFSKRARLTKTVGRKFIQNYST